MNALQADLRESANLPSFISKIEKARHIVIMTGAGISTSSGIPDFRSPNEGLYHKLQAFNLPHPEAIFSIDYFKENPKPFYSLIKEHLKDRNKYKPTICHYFQKMLVDRGQVQRIYTQNVDGLDEQAGVPDTKIVHAHGTIQSGTCISASCASTYSLEWMQKEFKDNDELICQKCGHHVKPDTILFGETLPKEFFDAIQQDFDKCDLLIVMGTSLKVQPFSDLVSRVPTNRPKLLLNHHLVGPWLAMNASSSRGYILGDCDSASIRLAEQLGLRNELGQYCQLPPALGAQISKETKTNSISKSRTADSDSTDQTGCFGIVGKRK